MRTTAETPAISNGIMYITLATGFALLSGTFSDLLFYFGLAMNIAIVLAWALHYESNRFLDNKIKVLQYMKYDFRNGPIYYLTAAGIWIVTIIQSIADYYAYGYVKTDILMALASIYFISCIMVLWGYTQEYDRLK
jgi:hypothetical protein